MVEIPREVNVEVDNVGEVKPGIRTTELILTLVVLAISGAMVLVNESLAAEDWVDLAKWVVGGYALSRGLAKL